MFDWRSFVGNLISRGTDPRYLLLVSCGREEGIERRVCRICWMDENASFFFFLSPPLFFFFLRNIDPKRDTRSFFLSFANQMVVRTAAPCGSCLIDRKPVTASTLARIKRHLRDQSRLFHLSTCRNCLAKGNASSNTQNPFSSFFFDPLRPFISYQPMKCCTRNVIIILVRIRVTKHKRVHAETLPPLFSLLPLFSLSIQRRRKGKEH